VQRRWRWKRFGIMNALAQTSDYRALVCIFLFGGNDRQQHGDSLHGLHSYSNAAPRIRIAIPKDSLLQVSPPGLSGSVADFIQP